MLAFIRFGCGACRARIKAPAQLLNQQRQCPRCGHGVIVRREPPEDAGPVLLLWQDQAPSRMWARKPA
jgi:hypothetical protein